MPINYGSNDVNTNGLITAKQMTVGVLDNDPGILNVYTNDASDASAQINLKNGGSVDRLSFSVNDETTESVIASTSDRFDITNYTRTINIQAGQININGSSVGLYDTSVFNLGTISGTNAINCGQDRQIQSLTLNGTATTFTKGTGWPLSNSVARETTLNIFSSGNTSITWTIVNDWYRQPDSPLPSGRHIVLLRSVGSGTMQGHYIGNKTN